MLEAGTIINERYRVLNLLGEGGMGSVFEGEHTGVGRKVAIKVLHQTYAKNEEIVGRFEREARAAAAIGHDNIIDVIDFGRHGEAPYMIMEFLKGESLGQRLEKEGRLTPEMAAHVMTQVLSALSAAHAVGIVHRDLKPDNVYLIQKGGISDYVKLLDFGISKFKAEGQGDSKGLTQTGAMMGTPYYMAPEQALAKRDIDHRADIYSAGVMLYQMVTGTLPFHAESQAELLMAIVYQPFGITPPRQHVPDLHPEFEAVILKAMSKEREGRWNNASEFAAALAPWASGGAIAIPDATGVSRVTNPAGQATPTPFQWQKPSTGQTGPNQAVAAPVPVGASPVAEKKSKGPLIAALSAVGVLAVVGGAVLLRPKPAPASANTTAANTATLNTPNGTSTAPTPNTATPPAATQAPTPPALPANVAVDLEGLPANATISVDGQPSTTPHLSFARGSSHTVRVTAPGMRAFETTLTAERDRSVVVALVPDAPAVAVAPQTPTAPQPPSTPTGSRPTVRNPRPTIAQPPVVNTTTSQPRPRLTSPTNPLQIGNEY